MPNAILVDPQHPFRATAPQPIRGRLHDAARDEVVAPSLLIQVFVVCGDDHPCTQLNPGSSFVETGIFVRQAEKLTENTVEIGAQSRRFFLL